MRQARPWRALLIAGFVVVGVLVWLLRAALETPPPTSPAPPAASVRKASAASPAVRSPEMPGFPPPVVTMPPPVGRPELRGHDSIDPCTAGWELTIPTEYEAATAHDVTVAWSPQKLNLGASDFALSPTAIAHLVSGLLEEAATLTGTPRRSRLIVVVYPSKVEFTAQSGAPVWAEGAYDGGAVHLPVTPTGELGISIASLRHEVMHAQLHVTIGCMPAWLNEGAAMYYAGQPPVRDWVRMLRTPDTFDLRSLDVPTLVEMPADRAHRAYAESLAMIAFLVEKDGEQGLRSALRALAQRDPAPLWERVSPGVDHRALMAALARKVFGIAPGAELDAMLAGVICCYGLRNVGELACRAGPSRPNSTTWIDRSDARRPICSRW